LDTNIIPDIGGLVRMRDAIIDDCTLARLVKQGGFRTWTGLSRDVRGTRTYEDLKEIWDMVARSAYTQLRYSLFLLFVCAFLMITLFWAPIVGIFSYSSGVQALSVIAWMAMIIAYIPTLLFYQRNPAWALLLPVTSGLYLAMTISSAIRYYRGERSRWKGRVYT